MESPVKKLDFSIANKENLPADSLEASSTDITSPRLIESLKRESKEVAPTATSIKPDYMDEPILQENPQRFVLFPIKYHEVCVPRRVSTRKVPP